MSLELSTDPVSIQVAPRILSALVLPGIAVKFKSDSRAIIGVLSLPYFSSLARPNLHPVSGPYKMNEYGY